MYNAILVLLRQLGTAKIFLGQFLGGGEVSKELEVSLTDGSQRPLQVGIASSQTCKMLPGLFLQYFFHDLKLIPNNSD